jgi:hypothetical protein
MHTSVELVVVIRRIPYMTEFRQVRPASTDSDIQSAERYCDAVPDQCNDRVDFSKLAGPSPTVPATLN